MVKMAKVLTYRVLETADVNIGRLNLQKILVFLRQILIFFRELAIVVNCRRDFNVNAFSISAYRLITD